MLLLNFNFNVRNKCISKTTLFIIQFFLDVRVCEREDLTINCPLNKKIYVISANYGKTVKDVCPSQFSDDLQCVSSNALAVTTQ